MNDRISTNKENILKIGFTAPGWPLCDYPNGIVAYIQNMLHGLNDKTEFIILAQSLVSFEPTNNVIDVSSFAVKRGILEKILDKIIYGIKIPSLKSVKYRRNITRYANRLNQAMQHLHKPLHLLEMEESFGSAYFVMKASKVPIITRLHGPWFLIGPILHAQDDWDFKLRILYEKKAIENAHGITSPSLDVLDKVRSYYGLALPNARVIPNPVLEVSIENRWELKTHKKPSILFVGRFDSVKGGDLILLSFQIIAKKNKSVELIFAGPDRGVTIEGELLKFDTFVGRFISDDNVKKRIRFLGHCDQLSVSNLRKEAIVTVVCSRYENFPLSLLEALAAGCPTVATAVGGMKEIIINNYNGLHASPESPEDIAEKVLELINDPEKMQFISKNAIDDCKNRFSPEVVALQTIDFYKTVIAN